MKIALITDQHFGARNDSIHFLDFYEKFYRDTFFPVIETEGIKHVFILGDTFDRRKYMNFYSLQRAKKMFFEELKNRDIQVTMLVGNHDTYFKNTNEVNSVNLLLKEYDNITAIQSPKTIELNGYEICMIPWICAENEFDCLNELKDTNASYCMGHFEIAGFAMYKGEICHEGLSKDFFRGFRRTFSGHYHHKSSSDNIDYLGNPYELTWQDYADQRGFHIFDLENNELRFIKNPNTIFYKYYYNDKDVEHSTFISNIDFNSFKNKYVKIVVVNKTNPYLFDQFMTKLYESNTLDISIAEDFTETEIQEEDDVDQAEDTVTILEKYVSNLSTPLNKDKLKSILKELYVEALNEE
jgi:DNA repair exonuclease SbcCD nuclease subunit